MNSLVPAQAEWAIMKEQAGLLVKTGFLPASINTDAKALAIMLKGRELQIPPMQAFAQIAVIQGKPAVGAELMLALIYRKFPNAPIDIVRRDDEACIIRASRPGRKETTEFRFTTEQAKRAGLDGKQTWKQYPDKMLFWRAVSDMARALYPDCLMGCSHTPEELGAEVNGDGEVIEVKAEPIATKQLNEKPETVDGIDIPFGTPAQSTANFKGGREVYTGTDTQKAELRKIFDARDITSDEERRAIAALLTNRPMTDINKAIAEHRKPQPVVAAH